MDAVFDNLTDEEENELTVNNFLEKQMVVVSKMNVERAKEVKEQVCLLSYHWHLQLIERISFFVHDYFKQYLDESIGYISKTYVKVMEI